MKSVFAKIIWPFWSYIISCLIENLLITVLIEIYIRTNTYLVQELKGPKKIIFRKRK